MSEAARSYHHLGQSTQQNSRLRRSVGAFIFCTQASLQGARSATDLAEQGLYLPQRFFGYLGLLLSYRPKCEPNPARRRKENYDGTRC